MANGEVSTFNSHTKCINCPKVGHKYKLNAKGREFNISENIQFQQKTP